MGQVAEGSLEGLPGEHISERQWLPEVPLKDVLFSTQRTCRRVQQVYDTIVLVFGALTLAGLPG